MVLIFFVVPGDGQVECVNKTGNLSHDKFPMILTKTKLTTKKTNLFYSMNSIAKIMQRFEICNFFSVNFFFLTIFTLLHFGIIQTRFVCPDIRKRIQ